MGEYKMAKAMDVADFIIKKAADLGHPVSNLMLQKVMYFLNVIHLLGNNRPNCNNPLITDAHFEKWAYGPVIKNVYQEYSGFDGNIINKPVKHLNTFQVEASGKIKYTFSNPNKINLPKSDQRFIKKYIKYFIKQNPFDLVNESHKEPQWKNRNLNQQDEQYNNQKSINFWSDPVNKFWEAA